MTTTAADTDGTIAQVEFFHGTTLIGTGTAAPSRVLWNGVPAGSYSLTASATDNQGAVTRSDPRVLPSSTLFACQMHKCGCGYNKNNGLARSQKFLVVTRLA
jgi:hypothetical protein